MTRGKFRVEWYPSSSAEIELFDPPGTGGERPYQFKYTSQFRTTIRPPLVESKLGKNELEMIDINLNELATTILARAGATVAASAAGQPAQAGSVLQKAQDLGELIYTLTIPPYIRPDLRAPGLFFELGMDESLLGYPWELMHDGEDFLCLKHKLGRFVNGTPKDVDVNRLPGLTRTTFDKLRILQISVPRPLPRGGESYDPLPQADVEAAEVAKILAADPDSIEFDEISGKDATFIEVMKGISKGGYHIIHFCGHAKFDDKNPQASSLVLYDQNLSAYAVNGLLLRAPIVPILCFVNACETAKTAKGKDQFNVFGLARAFLETGTYLLGTRWQVNDTAARHFAPKFYTALLGESKPLGEAIREARLECKKVSDDDDFAWASYILYGDPRVTFAR